MPQSRQDHSRLSCLWPEHMRPALWWRGAVGGQWGDPGLRPQTQVLAPAPSHTLSKSGPISGPQCSHLEVEDKIEQGPGGPQRLRSGSPRLSQLRKEEQKSSCPQAPLEPYSHPTGHWPLADPAYPLSTQQCPEPIRGSPWPGGRSGPDSFTRLMGSPLVGSGLPLQPCPLLFPPCLPHSNADLLLSLQSAT